MTIKIAKAGLVALSVILLAIVATGPIAFSVNSGNDNKIVSVQTEVFKKFAVALPADVNCNFSVEIDPANVDVPIIAQTTTCNNLLQFKANGSLDISITKTDITATPTPGSAAVLDALGLTIDTTSTGTFSTNCLFTDNTGAAATTGSVAAVLANAPVSNIWYDPTIDGGSGATQTVNLAFPGDVSGGFDCRFKLDFFLNSGEVQQLPAGLFNFRMDFITSAV